MRLCTCVGYTLPYEIGGTQKSKVLVASQANMAVVKRKVNKRVNSTVSIVSQNVRGIKSEARLEELFSYILHFGVLAVCLQ